MFLDMDKSAEQDARDRMVDNQIVARGIHDPAVIAAMRKIPRHLFLSTERQAEAYLDHPAPIDCNQTISQPYMVAVMTEMLALKPEARVLEIGTGSGYQTAVLAEIAGQVISMERHTLLADSARQRLEALGYSNITVIVRDGTLGYPEAAPYDAILITAGAPDIPKVLQQQLSPGGRLVAPVGRTDVQQLITITREDNDTFTRQPGISCRFVPLIGEHGWQE
jgi:protein-L-isoaspartate(D-aspartate) O-methyltransferase